ncbi:MULTISPECIES: phage holin [Oceanobacillus]|uniref:SPBc2 prophage-derived protein BhlB n=1 Tax=Oceanobacillus kimchii TaxID=746691 RepID=A0ABQ5TNZ0_9BACI|nr:MULTISPECIES: phage holin [Oceanobacillus]MBT2598601.1 phage holin [Oceanobacillus sp. ISL-74]MBT2651520.1 phage holin [Oceanobacillus sp. ISL-73]GLO66297.1 SPBc2 prophage-derived protein BhlB [Oceanobacillus kimchii]
MDKATLTRTIVLVIALVNQFLVIFGLNPILGTEQLWGEVITMIITAVAATWAWFKNNYVTARGKSQKEVLQRNSLIK